MPLPQALDESMAVLREAFNGLARDQDFLQDAIATMRFQPRFEVGDAGEKLYGKPPRSRRKWSLFSASISTRPTDSFRPSSDFVLMAKFVQDKSGPLTRRIEGRCDT